MKIFSIKTTCRTIKITLNIKKLVEKILKLHSVFGNVFAKSSETFGDNMAFIEIAKNKGIKPT